MQGELAFFADFLQLLRHAFADSGHFQQFFGLADELFYSLRQAFDSFSCIAIGANAEGVIAVDFHQIGGFVENSGYGFVVHVAISNTRSNQIVALRQEHGFLGKKKPSLEWLGFRDAAAVNGLHFDNFTGLWTLLALDDFKLHLITFLQALVALGSDGAVVNEDIRSIVAADESEALGIVKPLDCSFNTRHLRLPPN